LDLGQREIVGGAARAWHGTYRGIELELRSGRASRSVTADGAPRGCHLATARAAFRSQQASAGSGGRKRDGHLTDIRRIQRPKDNLAKMTEGPGIRGLRRCSGGRI